MNKLNIKNIIINSAKQLENVSESNFLDAELLLAKILHKNRAYLKTWPDKTLTEEQYGEFLFLLNKRLLGQPMAYILQKQAFWKQDLVVSPDVLIPRPETELLVELILEKFGDTKQISLCDLGTGSGAIAIALQTERPDWNITAIDQSQNAIDIAKINSNQYCKNKINFIQSNWFEKLHKKNKFNIILSNPPYIDPADKHLNLGDVRFEPKEALIAKKNGLADLEYIINEAIAYLHPNGWVFLEHGYDQGQNVRTFFSQSGYIKIQSFQDIAGHDRVTCACSC